MVPALALHSLPWAGFWVELELLALLRQPLPLLPLGLTVLALLSPLLPDQVAEHSVDWLLSLGCYRKQTRR